MGCKCTLLQNCCRPKSFCNKNNSLCLFFRYHRHPFFLLKLFFAIACSSHSVCQWFFFKSIIIFLNLMVTWYSFLKFVPLLIFIALWSPESLLVILRVHSPTFSYMTSSFYSPKGRVPKVLSQISYMSRTWPKK